MPPSAKSRAKTPPAGPADVDHLSPAPVYLLFGGDEYLVSQNCRRLVNRLVPPADQAFGLEIVDPRGDTVAEAVQALGQVLQGLQTLGFFGGSKTVWLRDAAFLTTARTMKSDETRQALDALVAEIKRGFGEGVVLVVSARALDKRGALFRACDAAGHALEYAVPDKGYLVERQARERIAELLKAAGLSADDAVVTRLIEKAGCDTRQLANEIEKLRLYLGERTALSVEDVREMVSPAREASSWDLEDAVGDRNLPLALRALRQLLFQGESPVGLAVRLEARFRDLMIFFACLSRKWCRLNGEYLNWSNRPEADAVLSRLPTDPRSMNSYRAGKLAGQALRYSGAELLAAQDLLSEAHERLTGSTLPRPLVLEFLVLRLVGPGPRNSGDSG